MSEFQILTRFKCRRGGANNNGDKLSDAASRRRAANRGPLKYEAQPKVQEPEIQQGPGAVKNGSVPVSGIAPC